MSAKSLLLAMIGAVSEIGKLCTHNLIIWPNYGFFFTWVQRTLTQMRIGIRI